MRANVITLLVKNLANASSVWQWSMLQRVRLESMAKIIALYSAGTLANLDIDEAYLPHIPLLTLATNTLKTFLCELGVDVILLIGKEIQNKGLALLCDKGKDKNSATSFVKLMC